MNRRKQHPLLFGGLPGPIGGILLLVVVLVVSASMTSCQSEEIQEAPAGENTCWLDWYGSDELPWEESREIRLPEFLGVVFRWTADELTASAKGGEETLAIGMPVWSVYFWDLNGDGKREVCAGISLGSGLIDDRIEVCDYAAGKGYELADRGSRDYRLRMEEDQVWAVCTDYETGDVLQEGPLQMGADGELSIGPAE